MTEDAIMKVVRFQKPEARGRKEGLSTESFLKDADRFDLMAFLKIGI